MQMRAKLTKQALARIAQLQQRRRRNRINAEPLPKVDRFAVIPAP